MTFTNKELHSMPMLNQNESSVIGTHGLFQLRFGFLVP